MTRLAWMGCALLLALSGCTGPAGPGDGEDDLGLVDGKADGSVRVRTVAVSIEPGATKYFRVSAIRFTAVLEQDGDVPARLSAKHYEIDIQGEQSTRPEISADADEARLRNWTLRVHNEGSERLTGVLTVSAVEELPDPGPDGVIREMDVDGLLGGQTRYFRVRAADIRAELTQDGEVLAQLSAKNYEIDEQGEPSTRPFVIARSPGGELRNWTIRVRNLGAEPLTGRLTVSVLSEDPEPPPSPGLPGVDDPVQYENEWCTYSDTPPYVREVHWDHPDVKAAMRALVPGYHSVISYTEWRVPYGLENERTGTEQEKADKIARNFVRVVCGEHRDYPDMLRAKLQQAATTHYAGPEELDNPDTSDNLFNQLTYPAYMRLVRVMRTVHAYRQQRDSNDGFHYGFGEHGHGSRRVEHGVPPFTHCEMRFTFERYLVAGAPYPDGATFESEYAAFRDTRCSAEDLAYMYNFRGHVAFQPLWMESNGFMMNSRRARGADTSRHDRGYYLHPFATRYAAARSAWGTYLLYPEADHGELIGASESGGGPIMYLIDHDADGDHLQDYKLFDDEGCGDMGVGLPVPSQNCNMVSWEEAWYTDDTTGHISTWEPSWFATPDMGFFRAVPTFEQRMARFNQALDRHTNWGPTGYYMIEASDQGDRSPRFFGAYSPIVAASYEVSKSDFFVRRDYPSTDDFERGRAKWLFVMRFPTDSYYGDEDMRNGRPMDFDRHYFNETSLSNDYYDEHALDHWGYIPSTEWYSQVYLTWGHRGETPPELYDVPPPP